jgi:phosphocarrier protein
MILIAGSRIRTVNIANPDGLHLRASASIAKVASEFHAQARVCRGRQQADAKSVLELVTLAAAQGTELRLEATGPDADQLLDALEELFENDFSVHTACGVGAGSSDQPATRIA